MKKLPKQIKRELAIKKHKPINPIKQLIADLGIDTKTPVEFFPPLVSILQEKPNQVH